MSNDRPYGFVLWAVPRFHRAEIAAPGYVGARVSGRDDRTTMCSQAMKVLAGLKAAEFAKVEACLSAS